MGAGHHDHQNPAAASASISDGLLVSAHTPVHALPPETKIVSMVLFVLVVVATPREQMWAFAAYAAVLVGVVVLARLPGLLVVRRMVIELPFVVFAVLLPFVALGERVDVGPFSVSAPGLMGAFNVLAKGSLGVVAAIVLSATTSPRDMVLGLQRLRVPALFVTIVSFMIRYLDIVVDDMRRMRIAREARGFQARHAGHVPVLARAAGALFVRAFERGERVHLAMLSRGFSGSLPLLAIRRTTSRDWATAALVPALALLVIGAALLAGDATAVSVGA